MSPGGSQSADPGALVGLVIGQHYRLTEVLGCGSVGTVYRARHEMESAAPQDFAVKILHPELAGDDRVRERFLREAQALRRFTHRHAVPLRHHGQEDGIVFLVLDHVDGETLGDLLEREGPLTEARAVDLVFQVLDVLAEAHAAGLVHRDVKPSNILVEHPPVGPPDFVRVVDFGLACVVREARAASAADGPPPADGLVGTPAYMSPEQVLVRSDVDPRSDLFSLGVVFYEMLAGRRPFLSDSTLSVMMHILESEPPPLLAWRGAAVSDAVRAVVFRALAKDRGQRFPSALAFADALRQARDAPGRSPRMRLRRVVGRTRTSWRWAALVVLLGAGWLVLASGGHASDVGALRRRGLQALENARYAEAAEILGDVAARAEARGEDHLHLAQARIALGREDAAAALRRSEQRLPGAALVSVAWANYEWKVRHDDARADVRFAEAALRDPACIEAYAGRALMLLEPAAEAYMPASEGDRLTFVEESLNALERVAPSDPRIPLLRSRVYEARARASSAVSADALRAAREEAERAMSWTAGAPAACLQLARILDLAAEVAREEGAHAKARRLSERSLATTGKALGHMTLPRDEDLMAAIVSLRVGVHHWLGQSAAAYADAKRLAGLLPGDTKVLATLADTARWAHRYDEAIGYYRTLRSVDANRNAVFNLAYCHHERARRAAATGGIPPARADIDQAIALYDAAARLAPKDPIVPAYRAEARLGRAALDPAQAAAAYGRAVADLAQAEEAWTGAADQRREIFLRVSRYRSAVGDLDGALAAIRTATGKDRGLDESFYRREVRCLLAIGCRAERAGDAVRALAVLTEARRVLAALGKPVERWAARTHLLAGLCSFCLATLRVPAGAGGGPTADATLAFGRAREAAQQEGEPGVEGEAALMSTALALEMAAGAGEGTQRLRARRLEDLAAGHRQPSSAWFEQLADLLTAAGRPADAERARRRGACILF